MGLRVKFWGVRGSIACPSPNHVVYGGNTSCIEVKVGDNLIILDAGTGIRNLGHDLMKRGVKEATLLLTHTHWDHINGFPFFAPAFVPGNQFKIMAGHLGDKGGIFQVFDSQMSQPMFPVPLAALNADLNFVDYECGDSWDEYGATISTAPLNHPNGACGYRLEYDGVTLAYCTDTEHEIGKRDPNVLKLMKDADLAIYDCCYTDEEYPAKKGWGHSTWQEGIRLAKEANVKRLAIFHHDPEHNDDFMEKLEDEARRAWENTIVARDNMELTLGD